jgi:hypothetical protein
MSPAPTPRFLHIHNRDGSHDSVCRACLATIDSARTEDELAGNEDAHVCEPVRTLLSMRGGLELV